MKWFYKIIDIVVKFWKSIIDPDNDWTPHPKYPWLEIDSNLSWRVNTQHPDWWKGFNEKWDNVDYNKTNIPHGQSQCLVCGKIHPNGLPCPKMNIT